jgi:ATP-dependent Lon protease
MLWPESAKELFQKNIEKLERMHPSTPDYSVVYNHLDLMLDLPWGTYTTDSYDLKKAQKILDHDHFGMDQIKDRIVEYLAVLKLKGDLKSPISLLCRSSGYRQNLPWPQHCQCYRPEICTPFTRRIA